MPTAAATGRLKGKAFTPDRVELEGEQLRFREGQGKELFPDLSVEIMLGSKANVADEPQARRPARSEMERWRPDVDGHLQGQ